MLTHNELFLAYASLVRKTGKESDVEAMELGGNRRGNQLFEAKLRDASAKPTARSEMSERKKFCHGKYVDRKFFDPSVYPVVLKDAHDQAEKRQADAEKQKSNQQQQPHRVMSKAAQQQRRKNAKGLKRQQSESALMSSYADLINNRSGPIVPLDENPFGGNPFDNKAAVESASSVFPVLQETVSENDFFMMSPTKSGAADDWFLSGKTKSNLKSLEFAGLDRSWHPESPLKESSKTKQRQEQQQRQDKSSTKDASKPQRMNRRGSMSRVASMKDMTTTPDEETTPAIDQNHSRPMNRRGSMTSGVPSRGMSLKRCQSSREMTGSLSLSRHSSTGSNSGRASMQKLRGNDNLSMSAHANPSRRVCARNSSKGTDGLSKSVHDSATTTRAKTKSKRVDGLSKSVHDSATSSRSRRSNDAAKARTIRRQNSQQSAGDDEVDSLSCSDSKSDNERTPSEGNGSISSIGGEQLAKQNGRSRSGRKASSSSSGKNNRSRSKSRSRRNGQSSRSKSRKRGTNTHGRISRNPSVGSASSVEMSSQTVPEKLTTNTRRRNNSSRDDMTTKTEPTRGTKSSRGTALSVRSSRDQRSSRSARSRSGGRRPARQSSTTDQTTLSGTVGRNKSESTAETDAETCSTAPSSSTSDMRFHPQEELCIDNNDLSEASEIADDDDDLRMFTMTVEG